MAFVCVKWPSKKINTSLWLVSIANGKKINSQKLKLPSGKILKSKNRELFEVTRIKLDVLKSELIIGLN